MRKIKHSKYRNTGFLFELLVRQVTADILEESTGVSKAEKLLKKYFNPKTELGKERKLYEVLLKKKFNSDAKAEQFINLVVQERKKLSDRQLKTEKYNLIKEIKESYPLDSFMRSPISNYKMLASIYKVFEANTINEMFDPTDVIDSKFTIIEEITSTPQTIVSEEDRAIALYRAQDKDTKILSYRILIERFNEKYKKALSVPQKRLLREFINNTIDQQSFRKFALGQLPAIKKDLLSKMPRVTDNITKIKLKETINTLDKLRSNKKIKDDNLVSALMLCYELSQEIDNVTRK